MDYKILPAGVSNSYHVSNDEYIVKSWVGPLWMRKYKAVLVEELS